MSRPHLVFLVPQEVAEILQVNRSTIYRWIRASKIPHIRLPSGDVRIPEHELEKWLADRHRKAV